MSGANFQFLISAGNLQIHEQVKAVVQEKREEDVLDSSLELCPIKEVNSVFSIALMCLETEPLKRPTMADIVKMLEKAKSDGKASDVSSQTVV